jgi:hypothetical protein
MQSVSDVRNLVGLGDRGRGAAVGGEHGQLVVGTVLVGNSTLNFDLRTRREGWAVASAVGRSLSADLMRPQCRRDDVVELHVSNSSYEEHSSGMI